VPSARRRWPHHKRASPPYEPASTGAPEGLAEVRSTDIKGTTRDGDGGRSLYEYASVAMVTAVAVVTAVALYMSTPRASRRRSLLIRVRLARHDGGRSKGRDGHQRYDSRW